MASRTNAVARVRHGGILSVAVAVVLLAGLGRPPDLGAAGTTRLVAPGGSDAGDCTSAPCHTIGHAIGVSSAGDTINVAAGTYSPSGNNESFPLSIFIPLTIAGAGSGGTIVDASQMNTVFSVSNSSGTVALSGMTIQNGKAPDGGKGGGGIYSTGALTLTDVTLSQNFSGQGTGDGGNGSNGGGIWSSGTLTLTNVTLSHNATGQGAHSQSGVGGNGGNGGGIFGADMKLTNVTVSNNTTGNGGDGDTVDGWSGGSGGSGGGIYQSGVLTLTNVTVNANSTGPGGSGADGGNGGNGGGICCGSGGLLTNVTLAGNQAGGGGGGSGSCVVFPGAGCLGTSAFGGAGGNGGGISGGGALTNVTLNGNRAGGGGTGPGVPPVACAVITGGGCTSTGGAGGAGGGIYGGGGLTNVTLNNNVTGRGGDNAGGDGGNGGDGGGIYIVPDVSLLSGYVLQLTNVTLNGNLTGGAGMGSKGKVGNGGGIGGNTAGQASLSNSILANSPSSLGGDCGKVNTVPTSKGGNVADDKSCGLTGTGDLSGVDPLLGPLQDNGGPSLGATGATSPTLTIALMPGSRAIGDGLAANCPATDQRLAPRPAGKACDSGAFQTGATPPSAGNSVSYAAGWNLAGGPSGTVFTGAAGTLFTLRAGDTSYESLPTSTALSGGMGVWAYFPTATTVTLPVVAAMTVTVTLPAGQFIQVGNPTDGPVTASGADVVDTYNASTQQYTVSTGTATIAAGQGAWAFSKAGGTLTITPVASTSSDRGP